MSTLSLSTRYSLGIYTALVGYFFLMKLLGLEEFTEFRLFNFFIVMGGLFLVVKESMSKNPKSYMQNLFLAIKTSTKTMFLVSISLLVYLSWINPGYMEILENSLVWGRNLSVQQVVLAILIEGISSTYVLSFIIMQYMKNWTAERNDIISKTLF